MTTNQTPIPEPTSLNAVVVGKRSGETVVAARMCNDGTPWVAGRRNRFPIWRNWSDLCAELTDIRVVDVTEVARPTKVAGCARCDRIEAHALGIEGLLGRRRDQLAKAREEIDQLLERIEELEAAKPEPGPWLRGDELEAVISTLKEHDVVMVGYKGHTATGDLWPEYGRLVMWEITVRTSKGKPGPHVDALRVIERAPEPDPEPGANIPDEVVEAARNVVRKATETYIGDTVIRLALAAADAKRAELNGVVR